MRLKSFSILLALVLLLAGTGFLVAQATPGTIIDWSVVASGGAWVSGGNITMEGTVGQPFVGPITGGQVSLGAGYWYALDLVEVYLPVMFRP